jgi:hypothetical protein
MSRHPSRRFVSKTIAFCAMPVFVRASAQVGVKSKAKKQPLI